MCCVIPGNAERHSWALGGWLDCPVPRRPTVLTTVCSGGGGTMLFFMYLLPVPSKHILGGFAVFSALQFHSCTAWTSQRGSFLHCPFVSCTGRRATNDHVFKSHLQMLLIWGVTRLHKSVVLAPHWLYLTQQLLCVLLAFRKSMGPESLPPVCTGTAPLM